MKFELEVRLVPVGQVPSKVIEILRLRLPPKFASCHVNIGRRLTDLSEFIDPTRSQLHSTRILVALEEKLADSQSVHLLGVTQADLFVPGLNFVFGEARKPGNVAVISTHRLKNADEALFESRLIKEAVHEIGHNLGLGHCADARCVMFFSNNIADTDSKDDAYCESCQRALMVAQAE